MNRSCNFSNVTNDYLAFYDCILCDMIDGMTHADLSDSISHNFITQMIPHHEGAIEMARNILKYTTNIPLQNLALRRANSAYHFRAACLQRPEIRHRMITPYISDVVKNRIIKMCACSSANIA